MIVQEAKNHFSSMLSEVSETPRLDVDCFLQKILSCDKTSLLMNSRQELSDPQVILMNSFVAERKKGLPVAYIIREKEFYGYSFYVTPDVLIPKPDTEILVEEAVRLLKEKISACEKTLKVLDMCTGSGCIAISVFRSLIDSEQIPLSKMPEFILADISSGALNIARKNGALLLSPEEQKKFLFVETNLFENISGRFDVLLTNPPYIPHGMVDELLKDGRSEPRLALDGDDEKSEDGLFLIRRILKSAPDYLEPQSVLLMETGEYNAEAASVIAGEEGFAEVSILKDLEGQLRVVKGRLQ